MKTLLFLLIFTAPAFSSAKIVVTPKAKGCKIDSMLTPGILVKVPGCSQDYCQVQMTCESGPAVVICGAVQGSCGPSFLETKSADVCLKESDEISSVAGFDTK